MRKSLYVDDTFVGFVDTNEQPVPCDVFWVGSLRGSSFTMQNIHVDELRIFDHVRTAAEIQTDYAAERP